MKVSDLVSMIKLRMNRQDIYNKAEYWDAKATEYKGEAVSFWPNNNLNYFYNIEQKTLIEKYMPDVKGLYILDAGCGTGKNSRYLASKGAKVLGVDFSAKSIEVAKEIKTEFSSNINYKVQSIYDLNDIEVYDIIVSWAFLAVATKDRSQLLDALTRMRKALKPDGKIMILEPIHKSFLHRVLYMSAKEFTQVMNEAGFKVETKDVIHLHFWPTRLALCFISFPKWFTAIGYYTGNFIIKYILGNKAMGDYKFIYVSKK